MKINANYTWIKCQKCEHVTKILPGQKFANLEEFAELFKCDCEEKPKVRKRVSNAT